MEGIDVKSTCGGTRLKFEILTEEIFLNYNLTRCKVLYSKPDKILKIIFQNLTRCIFVDSKSDTFYFFFNSKSDKLFNFVLKSATL